MSTPQREYQICSRCIMDTTDPEIIFDEEGVCNHCHHYVKIIQSDKYLAKRRNGALETLVAEIKKAGAGKKYDCIIGISGGVDSSYAAYLVKKQGLRPLAVHLDNGWDSELAVSNIESLLKKLEIDLYTYVLDWDRFRDLQLAFLKASTPDAEIPSDHAIIAGLYEIAAKQGVKYILIGVNTATEGGGVVAWSQGHTDWGYIKSVHKLFGTKRLKTFPYYSISKFIYYKFILKIKDIQILDYFDYHKQEAMAQLKELFGWKEYGGKHYESLYTRFYQGYICPQKFGFNKKREHLSFLIHSGQLTREQALQEMVKNDYPEALQAEDKIYVAKKFGISPEEFEQLMSLPPKTFWDYPSYKKRFSKYKKLIDFYHKIRRV